jgi:Flp pilus assembly protein TadG
MMNYPPLLSRFAADQKGAIAIIAALSMVSLVGAAGLAVDYSRGAQAKSALFAATDAAALAGARTFGTATERRDAAMRVFNANIEGHPTLQGIGMTGTNILKDGRNYGYQVRAKGDIRTSLGRVLGIDELGINTFAEAIASIGTRTEVSLVLDTTYSMTGWKIDTLKTAATRMVDELHGMAPPTDYLKIGVVPFSQYVNIGLPNRNKPWLDVIPDWTETIPQACYQECSNWAPSNCRMQNFPAEPAQPAVPATPASTCTGSNDGVPFTYSCGGNPGRPAVPARPARVEQVCDWTCSSQRNVCPPPQVVQHKWHGCVGSRPHPLDTRDSDYSTRIPALMKRPGQPSSQEVTCGTPLLGLTTSASTVKSTIASLTPNGETYIPAGLMWGWRQLSPGEPFAAHTPSSTAPARKFIVLMTDGLNTKSPTAPHHDGSDGALSNDRVKEICRNIAADKVTNAIIYSVAFAVTDAATKKILSDCARQTNGQFFDAQNQTQFLDAFSRITSQIAELRLSK